MKEQINKDNTFSTRLNEILSPIINNKDYKKKEIAKELEVSASAINQYLNKEREPAFYVLLNILKFIDTLIPNFNSDYLLLRSDSKIKENIDNLGLNDNTLLNINTIKNNGNFDELNQFFSNRRILNILSLLHELNGSIINSETNNLISIVNNLHINELDSKKKINFEDYKMYIKDTQINPKLDTYKMLLNKEFNKHIDELIEKSIISNINKEIESLELIKNKKEREEKRYNSLLFLKENYKQILQLKNEL